MKIANTGILLLVFSVLIKFSIDASSSYKKSVAQIDKLSVTIPEIFVHKLHESSHRILLAGAVENKIASPFKDSEYKVASANIHYDRIEDAKPMNFVSELVQFDSDQPKFSEIKTTFTDDYDEARPLDNSNTLINELLLMMPKR